MANFDRIDLTNYAVYGNDYDPQWDEIRAYLKSNAQAQRELEEIRRSMLQSAPRKKKDFFSQSPTSNDSADSTPSSSTQPSSNSNPPKKKWWDVLLGD